MICRPGLPVGRFPPGKLPSRATAGHTTLVTIDQATCLGDTKALVTLRWPHVRFFGCFAHDSFFFLLNTIPLRCHLGCPPVVSTWNVRVGLRGAVLGLFWDALGCVPFAFLKLSIHFRT